MEKTQKPKPNKTVRNCTADTTRPRGECSSHEWQCDNHECINIDFYCDGTRDCTDNSDEHRGCVPPGKVILNS